MERKIEITNPFLVAALVLLAIIVGAIIIFSNAVPFIVSGIKLGHNTDSASMLVNGHAGEKITIHYDVTINNGSLEIELGKGIFWPSAEKIWKMELETGTPNDSATVDVPESGLYLIHVQEHSFGGMYVISWDINQGK